MSFLGISTMPGHRLPASVTSLPHSPRECVNLVHPDPGDPVGNIRPSHRPLHGRNSASQYPVLVFALPMDHHGCSDHAFPSLLRP